MLSGNSTGFVNESLDVGNSSNSTTEINLYSSNIYMNLVVYRALIVLIAVAGMLANGIVFATIVSCKQLKSEKFNVLFLNQIALDLLSCAMLSLVQVLQLAHLYLTDSWGYWLCMLILNEMMLWIGLNGSTANLVAIAIERYVKIVHAAWHKNNFRPWMINAMVAFTWISGVALNVPLLVTTTVLTDGHCLALSNWANDRAPYIYGIWYFLYFFIAPVLIFIFCYGRILIVVRRQAKLVGANSGTTTTSGSLTATSHRIQVNVVKTMLTVTVMFVVCWLPNVIYYLLTIVILTFEPLVYYVTIFFAFFNICLNPFVYAGKHEVIKKHLKGNIRRCVGCMRQTAMADLSAAQLDQLPEPPAAPADSGNTISRRQAVRSV